MVANFYRPSWSFPYESVPHVPANRWTLGLTFRQPDLANQGFKGRNVFSRYPDLPSLPVIPLRRVVSLVIHYTPF